MLPQVLRWYSSSMLATKISQEDFNENDLISKIVVKDS